MESQEIKPPTERLNQRFNNLWYKYQYIRRTTKKEVKRECNNLWKEKWSATYNNKFRKIKENTRIFSSPKTDRSKQHWQGLDWAHGNDTTHAHITATISPTLYNECTVPITVDHLIIECQKYDNERMSGMLAEALGTEQDGLKKS